MLHLLGQPRHGTDPAAVLQNEKSAFKAKEVLHQQPCSPVTDRYFGRAAKYFLNDAGLYDQSLTFIK
jgi:hypothetical protein